MNDLIRRPGLLLGGILVLLFLLLLAQTIQEWQVVLA